MTAETVLGQSTSVDQQSRRFGWSLSIAFIGMMMLGLLLVALAWRSNANGFSVAVAALLVTLAAWIIHPVAGLNLTVFFALVGDSITVSWFPFAKNFSSHESLLYLSNSLTVTPLEITLIVAMASVIARRIAVPGTRIVTGPLFRPLMIFSGFVFIGLVHGVGTGGNTRVAVYEVRGLIYLPIIYFLVSNVCRTAQQYRRLLWIGLFGVVGQALFSLSYYGTLSTADKSSLEALGEHGASLAADVLIVFFLAACFVRGGTAWRRLLLGAMLVPTLWYYFIAQRRSAIVALGSAVILLFVVLFWRQRQTFWKVVPIFTIVVIGYTGAFWNVTSGPGFPAQAIKSVISPNSVDQRDKSSDLYRQIENFDLNFTIRQSKVLGLGFGQTFYRPVPLPDISFFEFYQYIPHNSVLWIWIKTGFAGFVSMLYLFSRAMMVGAQRIRRQRAGPDVATMAVAVAYVAMYAIYAFVDIAWDPRTMVLLGFALAACANFPSPVVEAAPEGIPTSRAAERPETHISRSGGRVPVRHVSD